MLLRSLRGVPTHRDDAAISALLLYLPAIALCEGGLPVAFSLDSASLQRYMQLKTSSTQGEPASLCSTDYPSTALSHDTHNSPANIIAIKIGRCP